MQLGVTAALMSYVLRALSMLSLLSRSGPVPVLHAAVCATFRHGCNSSSTAVQLCSKTSYLGPVFMITGWYYISVLITCVCCAADSQLRTILASDNNLSGPLPRLPGAAAVPARASPGQQRTHRDHAPCKPRYPMALFACPCHMTCLDEEVSSDCGSQYTSLSHSMLRSRLKVQLRQTYTSSALV